MNRITTARITAEIDTFVNEFQNIEVNYETEVNQTNSVFVHPPYMLQSVRLLGNIQEFKKLKERHQLRLQRVKIARDTASDEVNEFLKKQFYDEDGEEKLIASGRARLDEIKQLLQNAVDQKIISHSTDRKTYRDWMKKYGIGIDCSGFVQQILQRLVEVLYTEEKVENIPMVPFLRCGWVYRDITGNNGKEGDKFSKVALPSKIKPGDILVNRYHMRIVKDTQLSTDGILIEAAESTSGVDIPSGQEEEND